MDRRRLAVLVLAIVLAWTAGSTRDARAQDVEPAAPVQANAEQATARLRTRIQETWRVVPLTDGLLLVPRRASVRVKGVELSASGIAIDGRAVTGDEVVERLGRDAEPVLQLSYLSVTERLALFAEPADAPVERTREVPRVVEPPREPWPMHGGARVRVFGPITIREGEEVGDVVAVFGSIDLQGSASGDVVAVFGDVALGPKSRTRGNVVSVGGAVRPTDAAQVLGKLTEFRVDLPNLQLTVPGDDRFSIQVSPDWPRIAQVQWVSGVVGALIVLAICCFTVLVAPRAVEAVRQQPRSIVLAALVGFATQVLTLPAITLIASALTLSVIGIPLLALIPVLVLALCAAAVVGFTGMAARVGSVPLVGARAGVSVLAVIAGLTIIWAPGLVGRYLWAASGGYSPWGIGLAAGGALLEYLFWTIGLGAAVLAWRARRRPAVAAPLVASPPPVPQEL